MQQQSVESFEESWLNHQSNSFADRLARRSLRSVAFDVPELQSALDRLTEPSQEQLELNLTEGSVHGHAAPAESLSEVFKAIAEAVKEIGKDFSGRQRGTASLLAYAPSAGSVQLLFKVPEPSNSQRTFTGVDPSTTDAQALRLVAQVLASARHEDSALESVASRLPIKGRAAIRDLSKTVAKQGWYVKGRLLAKGRRPETLVFSTDDAKRLELAVTKREVSRKPVTLTGSPDGWVWSTGTLRFKPDRARAFVASVPANLQYEIAELVASRVENLTLKFVKIETLTPGSAKAVRTTYAVDEIPREDK